MSNSLIKKQLDKLKIAHVDSFDELKGCYHISKIKNIKFELNHAYLIQLNDVLLVEGDYSINMNKGSFPTHRFMKIYVNKIIGSNMIFVDGIYFDNVSKQDINEMWSGWLPTNEIILVEEL